MDKVFVSHASADKKFVDLFVDNVLYRGLGLQSSEIFYSSERDTGVPTGAELMSYVRQEVSETTLVIAIITPMYQSRPVCVAEFGAAWGRATPNFVFPLLAPGMKRLELEGVLRSMVTLSIDDEAALDELSDRIEQNWDRNVTKTQWGVGRRKWVTALRAAPKLEIPVVPTAEEHQKLLAERDELKATLDEVADELEEWKGKYEKLEKTKDAKASQAIRVGRTVKARFDHAVATATKALRGLPPPVLEAIYQSLRSNGATRPSTFENPDGVKEFNDAIERNFITERYGDGIFYPNHDKRLVGDAVKAVEVLQDVFKSEAGTDFTDWFEEEHPNLSADLSDRDCWEYLLAG